MKLCTTLDRQRKSGSYMVMARFCSGKMNHVWFLRGKLMYRPLHKDSL